MPLLLKRIHTSYLKFLKGSPPSTPTPADAPTTLPSLDLLIAENDVSSSTVEDDEDEQLFYDADDVPSPDLDPLVQVTPPSIIFDVDSASTHANDEQSGLAVPSSASSQPDDITRISIARQVSITQFFVSFAIHFSIETAYQF